MRYLFILAILFLLTGCTTVAKFSKVMATPGITPTIAEQKLGKSKSEIISKGDNTLTVQYYSRFLDDPLCAVFLNDKLVNYGMPDEYFWLNIGRSTGSISEDEYRWQFQQIQQEESNRRQLALQWLGVYQNNQYQQQALQSSQQSTYQHSGTIFDASTGKTYQYQGESHKGGRYGDF